jgi:hypothetical protein
MKRFPRPRNTINVSQQLNMYALAASAAGVGMIALSPTAEAKIIYTKANRVIGINHSYALDLNHSGVADFKIINTQTCTPGNTCTSRVSAIRYGKNAVEGTAGSQFFPPRAYALKAGARIGPEKLFSGRRMAGAGQTTEGNWYDVNNRYLGLKFQIKGETHYGWARLSVQLNEGFIVTLTGYAYETVPNKPITAGATKDSDEDDQPAPASLKMHTGEPATLGMLALGAPALVIWPRKEPVGPGTPAEPSPRAFL